VQEKRLPFHLGVQLANVPELHLELSFLLSMGLSNCAVPSIPQGTGRRL
jgi:hypothetical protein